MDPFPAPERRELAIGIMAERRIPCNFATKGIQCGLVLSLLLDRGLVITEQCSLPRNCFGAPRGVSLILPTVF